jgi:hypothetical protein
MLKKHGYLRAGWLLGLCAGLLFQPVCHAEESGWDSDRLVIKGFGTLGLARSDNDTAEYVRDLSQPRGLTTNWSSKVDSLVGLQANLKLGEQTEGVLQVISRYRYDGSYRPEISWAFLRHDFTPDFQMRLGRLGTEFYMLADSRLIGYANTTVRPPPDFYGPLVFSYFDGIDATASMNIGDDLLRAKLFLGKSPETTPFYGPITWDLDGSRLLGGHLDYFTGPWQFRLAHSEARFSSHEAPLNPLINQLIGSDPILSFLIPIPINLTALIPELSMVRKTSKFDSLGVVYDKGPLQIQAMLGRIRHESESYEDSRAGFVTAAYRVGKFTPYLGVSIAKSKASRITTIPAAPWGPLLAQLASSALTPSTHMDQHTYTVGTRWDFQQNWALKVQYDHIRGKESSNILFRGTDNQWSGRMKVLSVALDFAF